MYNLAYKEENKLYSIPTNILVHKTDTSKKGALHHKHSNLVR